ncbi:MAG: Signal peptidase [Verrucomicrobiota bacterium]|jgi:signal peptidase I
MFPFTPRYVHQARLYLREASKLLAYRKDIVSSQIVEEVDSAIRSLKESVRTRDRADVEAKMAALDQVCGKLQPPLREGGLKENVEVFIVAISIALGVRTYFVQPFTIPTGSMQPTLNGIITEITAQPPPNPVVRIFDFFARGRSYFSVVAERDETIQSVDERHYFGIPLGLFTYSAIRTNQGVYKVRVPVTSLHQDSRCVVGRSFKKGEIITRGHSNTGDHVLVNKFSYHFVRPKRGDVFVFNTGGIPTQENVFRPGSPSQFYIKRLAATPGDEVRIEAPNLYLNGSLAGHPAFTRVMSGNLEHPKDGYQGYSNQANFPHLSTPKSTYNVPAGAFFALGDNSYHSSDSRHWGSVPERNVMGCGWMVYWPFSRHWGPVR